MKRKGLFLVLILTMLVAAVLGLTACNGNANSGGGGNGNTNPSTYTVTFETNGGTATGQMTVDEGKSITLPTPTKDGYTFEGWFENKELNGGKLSDTYIPSGNVTLYAKWSKNEVPVVKFTVTFETNGGTATDQMTVDEGKSITLPTTSKLGYVFKGWFDNPNFSGEALTSPYTPTTDVTLYARWQIPLLKYVLNADGQSYSVFGVNDKTITEITIPADYNDKPVTGIRDSAFTDCRSLISITISHSVTEIDSKAFINNASLSSITVDSKNKKYHSIDNCLIETGTNTLILGRKNSVIPTDGSVTSIGSYAFANSLALTSITIPDGVTSIGESAFRGCSDLKSITIPDGVMSIGESAFRVCSFASITIPDSVTSIGSNAFFACINLTSITIPDSVTSISTTTFINCKALTSISLGSGVTSIGFGAFTNCLALTSITIPYNVTNIDASAFRNCKGLTNIIYNGTKAQWKEITKQAEWDIDTENYTIICSDAKWSKNGYTVTFETNEGTAVSEMTATEGNSITLPTTSRNGHTFEGWFDNPDFTGNVLTSPYTPSDNVTLYAKWSKIEYTVTFETNGGTLVESVTVQQGGSVDLPTPIKDGFMFDGWFAKADLTGSKLTGSYTPRENITLYAKYITDPLTYSLNGESYTVTGLEDKTITEIIIPKIYNSKPVTAIGDSAFRNCTGLTSVTIPDSVTSIGTDAFYFCTGLKSITIPGSVTSIGESAFSSCRSLTSITIPKSVTSISKSAFFSCTGLKSITIPNGVTSIGEGAFNDCERLTSITIPDSVTSIGSHAFFSCSSLTSITIPDGVTSIGGNAFEGTAWYSKQPDGLVYAGKVAYEYKGSMPSNTSITLKSDTVAIADAAFGGCSSLTSIIIPDNVTIIGGGAFSGCSSLTSITIPDGVTIIGGGAFYGCSSLTSITIPDGVTSIGEFTFSGCSSLTSIIIGNGVTGIGSFAFQDCSSLTDVTIGNGVTSISDQVFAGCIGLESITVATGNTTYHSEGNCLIRTATKTLIASCKTSVIPNDGSVTSIGSYAFVECGLTSITIPDSVTSIGSYAFAGCSALTSILIGNGVTSISDRVFAGCIGLESITVATGNTTYHSEGNCLIRTTTKTLIAGCKTSVIPNGGSVTSIGGGAFFFCSSLTSITIPDSVTSIASYAFAGCSALTSIIIGNGVTGIGSFAFQDCGSLTDVTIGNGVTSIASYAFAGCSALTSITIPDSVKSISQGAFDNCNSLTNITYKGTKAEWKRIHKGVGDYNTGDYTVTCTDGTLSKSEV